MKLYNSRKVYWTNIRSKQAQIQKYVWDNLDKPLTKIVLEIRPDVAVGLLHQIKVAVPQATDFNALLLNSFEDSTADNTISTIVSYTTQNLLLYDSNIGPAYFISGYKTMKNEKEAQHRPDGTTEPEPVLALVIERQAGSGDATKIEGELVIEGSFLTNQSGRNSLVAKRWGK